MKHRILSLAVISSLLGGVAFADSGQEIFEKKCATCHGKDGKGDTKMGHERKVKDMTDPSYQATFTDAQAIKDVTDGVPEKKFPSFKEKLSADEIASAVKHIRSLAPPAAAK